MPRRRLHGVTQARRRKKRTRLLKLSGSVTRAQTVQKTETFERSDHLEREDLEFLQVMREMNVRRSPWNGESPARRKAVETVHFQIDREDEGLFQRSMIAHGVKPLPERGRGSKTALARGGSPDLEARTSRPVSANMVADTQEPVDPTQSAEPLSAAQGPPTPAPTPDPHKPVAPSARKDSAPPVDPTRFEEEADGGALLEAVLNDPRFDPGQKFAGAAIKTAPRSQPRIDPESLEPDSQLDLHGKTQVEAIHMVQNFMLVSYRQRLRNVLIITGRGRNSGEQGPVLREVVFRWLERNGGRYVQTFGWAPRRHGGEGALWVTLR